MSQSRSWSGWQVAGVLVCCLMVSGTARSQSDDRLAITHLSGALEWDLTRTDHRNRLSDGTELLGVETILEASLELELTGYVYHPRFLEFEIDGMINRLQERFEGEQHSSDADTFSWEGDIRVTFLQKHLYPLQFYSRNYDSVIERSFLPGINVHLAEYGAIWVWRSKEFPMHLELSRLTASRFDFLDGEDRGEREETRFRYDARWLQSPVSRWRFVVEREAITEADDPDETVSLDGRLTHNWQFGTARQHLLLSSLDYLDLDGVDRETEWRWREQTVFELTDRLSSSMHLEASERQDLRPSEELRQKRLVAGGSLTHHLYDSLDSTLAGELRRTDTEDYSLVESWRLGPRFNYTKKNPWGRFEAGYGFTVQNEERSGSRDVEPVIAEEYTFADPAPVTLNRTDVLTSSVVVRSQDLLTSYVEGTDYTLVPFGRRLEVHRVPSGTITDGQTVAIDYSYRTGLNQTIRSTGQFYRVAQHFSWGLTLRHNASVIDEERDGELETVDIRTSTRVWGADYEWRSFAATVEYEEVDSDQSYQELRARISNSLRLTDPGLTLVLSSDWSHTQHEPPTVREVVSWSVNGRCIMPLSQRLTLSSGLQYRDVQDSLAGDSEGFGFDAKLEYRLRRTFFELSYESRTFTSDTLDSDRGRAELKIRREF